MGKEARLILQVTNGDGCWGALMEAYKERYRMDDVMRLAERRYTEVLESEVKSVEGELQDESQTNILTWEDGMCETMRIYEKLI